MKYQFPQFNLEIEPTEIIVDLETIRDRAVSKLLSVNVLLKTDTVTYCHTLENIPYTDVWYDEDVESLALDFLNDPDNGFIVVE
jgi:hypothetical protein